MKIMAELVKYAYLVDRTAKMVKKLAKSSG